MIRAALAAIVLSWAIGPAPGQTPGASAREAASWPPAIVQAPAGCTTPDDDGEWRARCEAAASLTELTWKWRFLRTGEAVAARPGAPVVTPANTLSSAAAPRGPAYLLHIPLLI